MAFKSPEVTGERKEEVTFSVTSLTAKSTAGTKVGDLITLQVMIELELSSITATGWTLLGTLAKSGSTWGYYYRVATEAGEKSFTVSWTGSAGAASWGTGRITKVNSTTPVVGSASVAVAASTTVKFPTATPTAGKKPTLDYLMYMPDGEIGTTTPAGFTADGTKNAACFYREYNSEAATGETTTTQGSSEHFGTVRFFVLGEEEAVGGSIPHNLTLLGVGS